MQDDRFDEDALIQELLSEGDESGAQSEDEASVQDVLSDEVAVDEDDELAELYESVSAGESGEETQTTPVDEDEVEAILHDILAEEEQSSSQSEQELDTLEYGELEEEEEPGSVSPGMEQGDEVDELLRSVLAEEDEGAQGEGTYVTALGEPEQEETDLHDDEVDAILQRVLAEAADEDDQPRYETAPQTLNTSALASELPDFDTFTAEVAEAWVHMDEQPELMFKIREVWDLLHHHVDESERAGKLDSLKILLQERATERAVEEVDSEEIIRRLLEGDTEETPVELADESRYEEADEGEGGAAAPAQAESEDFTDEAVNETEAIIQALLKDEGEGAGEEAAGEQTDESGIDLSSLLREPAPEPEQPRTPAYPDKPRPEPAAAVRPVPSPRPEPSLESVFQPGTGAQLEKPGGSNTLLWWMMAVLVLAGIGWWWWSAGEEEPVASTPEPAPRVERPKAMPTPSPRTEPVRPKPQPRVEPETTYRKPPPPGTSRRELDESAMAPYTRFSQPVEEEFDVPPTEPVMPMVEDDLVEEAYQQPVIGEPYQQPAMDEPLVVSEEGWAVNLQSFYHDSAPADEELDRLGAMGIRAEKVYVIVHNKPWYRIRITGFNSKEEARAYGEQLQSEHQMTFWLNRVGE